MTDNTLSPELVELAKRRAKYLNDLVGDNPAAWGRFLPYVHDTITAALSHLEAQIRKDEREQVLLEQLASLKGKSLFPYLTADEWLRAYARERGLDLTGEAE